MITINLSNDDAVRLLKILKALKTWRDLDKVRQLTNGVLPESRSEQTDDCRMTEEEFWLREHYDNADVSGLLATLERAAN